MEFVGVALIDALLRHDRNTGITLVRKRITADQVGSGQKQRDTAKE